MRTELKKHPRAVSRAGLSAFVVGALIALACLIFGAAPGARATPYASGITNNGSGTMSFYLNESGGNVTIKYEDGSTNASYNGITSGLNQASGAHTFSLGAHTNYTISVYKVGAGVPTLITNSLAFTPRGVDVNKNVTSPFFGRVYVDYSNGSGIGAFNPDMTLAYEGAGSPGGGCVWFGGGFSPYRCFVAADDYLMVGDASWSYGAGVTGALQNDGVWRIDPNLTTAQLFLGPRGEANGVAGIGAGPIHSTIQSRPVLLGNPSLGGPVTLVTVDGDYSWANGYNSLLVYTNITLATLPWENVPDIQGPAVGLNSSGQGLGGNEYPGLQFFGNYIYAGTYRDNYALPCVQIYTNDIGSGNTLAEVWDSITAVGGTLGTGPDLFVRTVGGLTHGTVDVAVSPDGKFIVAQAIDNWFVIAYLTNGIPDSSRVFNNIPTSYTGNGRGIAFDAADNIYVSSSGLGLIQSWSLGLTTIADTTGNPNGPTGFILTRMTNCPAITVAPGTLPAGTAGSGYNQTITASGGSAPYTFSVTGGGLPAGLTPADAAGARKGMQKLATHAAASPKCRKEYKV